MFWFIIFENINQINDSEVDKITHRCTYITFTYVQNVSLNDTKHDIKSEWNRIRKINWCLRVLLCTSALYYLCVNPIFSFKVFNTTRLRTPLICLSVCLSVRLSSCVCVSVCLPIQLSSYLYHSHSFFYSSFFLFLFLTSPHYIVITIIKITFFYLHLLHSHFAGDSFRHRLKEERKNK